MAKRKRKKSTGIRFSTIRRLFYLVVALAAGYGIFQYEESPRLGPNSGNVFAAFARLDITAPQIARMKESPIPPRSKPSTAKWRTIKTVLDGDTLLLDDGTNVRFLGIDAPESSENRKMYTDIGKAGLGDVKRDMVALGKVAGQRLKERAEGKRCWLETERNPKDQYGRTLAYIHLDDGTILNEWMLEQGLAKVYLSYNFRYKKRYILLQTAAQLNGRGFWASQDGGNN